MNLFARTVLCLAAFLFSQFSSAETEPPIAQTVAGQVRGWALPASGAAFRGIPFAQPPIGDLRWREPMPGKSWAGVRDSSEPGPPCAQAAFGWNDKFASAGKEDCLYLDVWTPEWPTKSKLPVMVWIHGGGNVAGAGGSDPLYDGNVIIRHGVVLVVIQYRLGMLGFFSHPELSRESSHHASGNYGILDQIAALHWIRGNIANFGGDPRNVTVFGQSAGSMDTLLLMATPLSKDLFHHAIGESGALYENPLARADAEHKGSASAETLKAPDLKSLRSLAVDQLLKSDGYQGIVVDGHVFPSAPAQLLASSPHRVPLLLGSNAIEIRAEAYLANLQKMVTDRYKADPGEALLLYGLAGPDRTGTNDPVYGDLADQLGSDSMHCDLVKHGIWHSEAGNPTWEYQFDRAIPPRPKVGHSSELPYVFGNLYSEGSQAGTFDDTDRKISATLQTYWTNFAKTGDPNGEGLPAWPRFDGKTRKYLEFTSAGELPVKQNQRKEFCDLLPVEGNAKAR